MGAHQILFSKYDIFVGPNISFDAALSDFMVQKIFLNSLSSTLCFVRCKVEVGPTAKEMTVFCDR